ncbi:putative translation initiation protein sua5 protein [Neofusicoccum parvum UCRNP2]|uniref:Threonylcarbamoyl-AMP synthase n=2 Tax=Neofusicoccum parvum TaxID=310453 RepID=R1GAH6_BOTPV|nr:putative translation initiation protein sua5 protein [Neofusicoccum parvum UCRNP2]GME36250.1 putative translation initiation protein sua5 protein [Neofusicoccum parvum]
MSAAAAAVNGHATPATPADPAATMPPQTRILPVDAAKLGSVTLSRPSPDALLEDWHVAWPDTGSDIAHLRQAAAELQDGTLPVAFPTETVYGLGADATSSIAVRGIYTAKQRPSDNPLIVHIASLAQLRALLRSPTDTTTRDADLIPPIYHPLIRRFWPGPLTIILPLPTPSPLAPEVTAGLSTFGARMPGSLVALLLLRLADRPVAAPSANASTKPSPTAAEHVAHDLAGRIRTILDGGPCDIGVESTVVDGVSGDRPVILRPGGVSIDELRRCEGWEDVGVAYKDKAEMDAAGNADGGKAGTKREAPRAPGMKYRHYSPRAPVVLFEAGTGVPGRDAVQGKRKVGAIRTKKWPRGCGLPVSLPDARNGKGAGGEVAAVPASNGVQHQSSQGFSKMLDTLTVRPTPKPQRLVSEDAGQEIWEVELGVETKDIARGLFSALRELDRKDVDIIFVEGIDEKEGDVAAAVMNRLRKAAEVEVKGS